MEWSDDFICLKTILIIINRDNKNLSSFTGQCSLSLNVRKCDKLLIYKNKLDCITPSFGESRYLSSLIPISIYPSCLNMKEICNWGKGTINAPTPISHEGDR